MQFLVGDTVDFRSENAELEVVEIATLEEFLAFVAGEKCEVIVHRPQDGLWKLEIYNDYRE